MGLYSREELLRPVVIFYFIPHLAAGDSFLSHLEWQPKGPALYLHPREVQPGFNRAHLQDLRPAGGR